MHRRLVVDEGRLRGVITNPDLMMLQGTSPLAAAREIENQQELDGIVSTAGRITPLVGLLRFFSFGKGVRETATLDGDPRTHRCRRGR